MRSSFLLVSMALLSGSVAAATDFPTAEVFLGYNFVRFNPNSGYLPSFNAHGGGGQFAYNFTRWIGGVFDAGAVTKGGINHLDIDATVINFVAGPRLTFYNHSRFLPFGQVLFGGAYSTASLPITGNGILVPPGLIVNPNLPLTARLNASNTGFAMFAGGGVDVRINKHAAFRPIGVDYYLTRLPSLLTGGTTNRHNFRYSAGVNFWFGAK